MIVNGDGNLELSEQVPASNLPSYVDDVVNYTSFDDFPVTGETGKIYIETDTNHSFRWNGSGYSLISSNPYVLFYDHFNTALQLNENYPTLGQKYPTWKRDFSMGGKNIYQGGYIFCTDIGSTVPSGDPGYAPTDGTGGVLHFQFVYDSANRRTLMHQKMDANNNDIENVDTLRTTDIYTSGLYQYNIKQPMIRSFVVDTSSTTAGVPVRCTAVGGMITSVFTTLDGNSCSHNLGNDGTFEYIEVTPVSNGQRALLRVVSFHY